MLLSTGAMVAQYVRQKVNLAFNNQVHYLNNFLLFTSRDNFSQKYFSILNYIASKKSWSILVIENCSHTNAIVVLIEMIVFKHVICPNISSMKGNRYYSRKLLNHFLKTPLNQKPLLTKLFIPVRTRFDLAAFHCIFNLTIRGLSKFKNNEAVPLYSIYTHSHIDVL